MEFCNLKHIWTSEHQRLLWQDQECPQPDKKTSHDQNSGSHFYGEEGSTSCIPCNVSFVYYVAEDRFEYEYLVQQMARGLRSEMGHERNGAVWKKLWEMIQARKWRSRSTCRQRGFNRGLRCRLGRFKVRTVDSGEVIVSPTNQVPPAATDK